MVTYTVGHVLKATKKPKYAPMIETGSYAEAYKVLMEASNTGLSQLTQFRDEEVVGIWIADKRKETCHYFKINDNI